MQRVLSLHSVGAIILVLACLCGCNQSGDESEGSPSLTLEEKGICKASAEEFMTAWVNKGSAAAILLMDQRGRGRSGEINPTETVLDNFKPIKIAASVVADGEGMFMISNFDGVIQVCDFKASFEEPKAEGNPTQMSFRIHVAKDTKKVVGIDTY